MSRCILVRTRCAAMSGVAAVLLMAAVPCLAAQESPASKQGPPGTMGPRYVDGSFGFAILPPAGCETLREKRFLGTDDVEVVRFVNMDAMWSLSVRQTKPQRALDPEAVGQMVVEELKETCPDVAVVKTDTSQLGLREVLRCTAAMTSRGTPVLRQQAMIRVKPSEYFTVILVTPRADEKPATVIFDKALASFEVVRSEDKERELREALIRGSKLLQLVRLGSLDVVVKEPKETFLRYIEGGEEIGFMQIRMEPATVDGRKGMAVLKWSWIFHANGSADLMQQDMFVNANLLFEKWDSRLIVVSPPPKGGGQRQISQEGESGIRQGDKLLVGYAGRSTGRQVTQKEIDVDKTYASAPWDVLLPTVVDLSKNELYAFSSFDSARRGLSLQTFRMTGFKTLPTGGEVAMIEESEGLIPPIHEVYVDRLGQIQRVLMKTGEKPLELVAATRQAVERRYGARIKEIEQLMPGPMPPATAPAGAKVPEKAGRGVGGMIR
jgi:hypothetical protein